MRVVADTAVWISYLKVGAHGPAGRLDVLLDSGSVLVCGPVVAEVLTGADESQREQLWSLLASLPWAELGLSEWRKVGEVSAKLRASGLSLPLTDIETAVAATASGADVWTADEDFGRIQRVFPELSFFAAAW